MVHATCETRKLHFIFKIQCNYRISERIASQLNADLRFEFLLDGSPHYLSTTFRFITRIQPASNTATNPVVTFYLERFL